jgi:hypothetical protein
LPLLLLLLQLLQLSTETLLSVHVCSLPGEPCEQIGFTAL